MERTLVVTERTPPADITASLDHYLAEVRRQNGLEAVVLSTETGDFISGAGDIDLEWLGALGSSKKLDAFWWDEHELHVEPLRVNHVALWLTSAGSHAPDADQLSAISRILVAEPR
jgi:hypothetical protein